MKDQELSQILQKIDLLMQDLANAPKPSGRIKQKLEDKYRLEWNFHSNHIEGNTLTYGQTELLLFKGKAIGDHEKQEYDEMEAHDVAIEMIRDWAQDDSRDMTEADLRELNRVILVRPFWKEAITQDGQQTRKKIIPGQPKSSPNSVRLKSGQIHHYASPEETPAEMHKLLDWYKKSESEHPLPKAAIAHHEFTKIHPFDDGNGRVARLWLNYILIKAGYPPLIVRTENKEQYLTALERADAGEIEPFVRFLGEELIWSIELTLKAAKGESLDEPDDLDKKLAILETKLNTINPEEEVRKHFDRDVAMEIFEGWFSELVRKAVPVIQKFNRFFIETRHSVQNGSYQVNFVDDSADEILGKLKERSMGDTNQNHFNSHNYEMEVATFFGTFKKGGLRSFGCNYGIRVHFETIKYQVKIDRFVPNQKARTEVQIHEKLLHQSLTTGEIDALVKELGETIYQHIEFYSNELGL